MRLEHSRGDGYHKATHLPSTSGYATVSVTPRGMSAVDFGPYKGHEKESWADKHDSPIMQYPACGELHSVFMVMDSSQGGGVLVGCGQDPTSLRGPNYGYGLRRFETTGALSTLVPGDYTLLTAASLASGKWNVILDGELRRNLGCEIRMDGNSLTLSVKAPGMTLIVR